MLQRKMNETEIRTILNQFGSFQVNTDSAINFPQGLIGVTGTNNFCVLPCPHEKFKGFMLLQSLDSELCLMTLPMEASNSKFHSTSDLDDAREYLGIAKEDLAMLLVVSMKDMDGAKKLVANTRAPIFIDTKHQLAAQFVLPNANYDMQQEL